MKLDVGEIEGLAAFCARRFPAGQDRARFAVAAGLPAPENAAPGSEDATRAWGRLLRDAEARGVMARLVEAVAAAAPNDENLQAARVILADRPPAATMRWGLVGAGAAFMAMVGGGLWIWAGRSEAPPAGSRTGQPVVAPPAAAPPPAATSAAPVAAPPVEAPPVAVPAVPVPAVPVPAVPVPAVPVPAVPVPAVPVPAVAAPVVAPAVAPEVAPRSPAVTACDGVPGEVAGWWYAGTSSPGAQGATITLDRDARVRADYPRDENHFDAQATERCVLARGTHQHLSHAPVNVSGAHWWVPYAPGDSVR